jgi:hypothetical protein
MTMNDDKLNIIEPNDLCWTVSDWSGCVPELCVSQEQLDKNKKDWEIIYEKTF